MPIPLNVFTRISTPHSTNQTSAQDDGTPSASPQRAYRRRDDSRRDKGKLRLASQRKIELDLFYRDSDVGIQYAFYVSMIRLLGESVAC